MSSNSYLARKKIYQRKLAEDLILAKSTIAIKFQIAVPDFDKPVLLNAIPRHYLG
jgi:hypothetical protein